MVATRVQPKGIRELENIRAPVGEMARILTGTQYLVNQESLDAGSST
jgi:hypothetical protein